MHAIVFAMTDARPTMQIVTGNPNKAWYQNTRDQNSLLDRLNLIGLTAIQAQRDIDATQPIIVMGCFGQQPRDAVAHSLKQWRRRFSNHFHSIFVCTGAGCIPDNHETELANYMDTIANTRVYKLLENEKLLHYLLPWHWDQEASFER